MTAQDYLRTAQAFYESASFRRCRERALEGLETYPEDPSLLRLLGRCSLELGLDDAHLHLRKALELEPEDAEAWHSLGLCLLQMGNREEAAGAFRRVVQLDPDIVTALVDLGHTLYALGRVDEAISVLGDAAARRPADLSTLRNLVHLYRLAGRPEAALEISTIIGQRWPNDVAAIVDAGDLHLMLGQIDEAVSEYSRLRELDVDPGHEVYAYHGLIYAEIQRGRWRRALDLAIDAASIDRFDVTTQLLAYVAVQLFGRSERPAPSRAELEAALAAEREEHRRQHLEALAL